MRASPQKNLPSTSGKLSTRAAEVAKFTFIMYKDSTDKALEDEIVSLRKANTDMEARYGKFSKDLQAENESLKQAIDQYKQSDDKRQGNDASEFTSLCKDWQQIVDNMGLFSIDGTNTAKSHAELSAVHQAQAQKFAKQEKEMIEVTEEFETALNEKDKTIERMSH